MSNIQDAVIKATLIRKLMHQDAKFLSIKDTAVYEIVDQLLQDIIGN